jgi:N5-(cytidine 5'-diphosphoramidyl)-L-glutamine hydrolase
MSHIAVTMRCEQAAAVGETRDALDERWPAFLAEVGVTPILVPNHGGALHRILEGTPLRGVLLTGGGDLARYGGKFPQRDAVESKLLAVAIERKLPVIGVCRGMQVLQTHFGVALRKFPGHVMPHQTIRIHGNSEQVNSYHDWGSHSSVPSLHVWAQADDGVVKAVRHTQLPLVGIMWHPERMETFRPADIALFRELFL